jgi:hypothetical protein
VADDGDCDGDEGKDDRAKDDPRGEVEAQGLRPLGGGEEDAEGDFRSKEGEFVGRCYCTAIAMNVEFGQGRERGTNRLVIISIGTRRTTGIIDTARAVTVSGG